MNHLSTLGRVCFGVAIAASGVMQLVLRQFVRLVPNLPGWFPAQPAFAVGIGAVLVAVGLAIAFGKRTPLAAGVLVVLLLCTFLLQRVPEILAHPEQGYIWTNPAKVCALAGGALMLALAPSTWSAKARTSAAWVLGIFLLTCGAQHFWYAPFVDTLVPTWIPPSQRFWTYFAGASLLAGGLGVILPRTRRLAGTMTGVMIFLWVILLHIPRSVEIKSAFELAGVFEALALSGVAWLVAGGDRSESASRTR
jgi:uncharacterized membrane protein